MVVLGNPPYRTRAIRQAKWVLDKEGRQRSLLDDFKETDQRKYEYKLHGLAACFWRWSLWKAFESTSDARGIVAFITTSAYLDGPGFAGIRRYLREHTDLAGLLTFHQKVIGLLSGHASFPAWRIRMGAVCGIAPMAAYGSTY
jgi:hypothetical protein